MDGENPTVPDHLRPLLGAAAELELEHATDGCRATDEDDGAVARARLSHVVRQASLTRDRILFRDAVGGMPM
jgi:hypothetical protein